MNCRNCQSEDIQKLEVVYLKEVGTFNSLGASISEGNGVGLAVTRGGISSLLAKKIEPPKPMPESTDYKFYIISFYIVIVMDIFILANIIDSRNWNDSFGFLVFPCIIALLLYNSYKKGKAKFEKELYYNQTIYPKLYKEWQDSWYCNRCGNIFNLE